MLNVQDFVEAHLYQDEETVDIRVSGSLGCMEEKYDTQIYKNGERCPF